MRAEITCHKTKTDFERECKVHLASFFAWRALVGFDPTV